MCKMVPILLASLCAVAMLAVATAQPPSRQPPGESTKKAKDYSNAPLVVRMMAFDKNKDGKLTKDEITDPRLQRLFDRADANKDGVVTKEELMALAAQLEAESPQGRGFGGPDGFGGPGRGGRGGPGRGGFGPPGGPGPDGPGGFGPPGGPGGFGGPPRPGQIFPPFLLERLNLTDKQKQQLDDLQKEVDSRLGKILTGQQKQQLQEMRGGFGGRGGRGPDGPGRGGPGGPGGDERPPE